MSLALATSALRRSLAPLALRGSRLALPKFAPVAALGARHAGTFKHHHTSDNSTESKFEFDEESEKEIAFTLSKYPDTLQGKQSAIMPMLWIVQQQLDKAHPTMKFKHADPNATKFPKSQGGGGWVPISGMHAIADRLGCSHMEVYEVATFFTMYNRDKLGKFHIQLCATTPCADSFFAEPDNDVYLWTLPINMTAASARLRLKDLRERRWIDLQTRELRVYFTVYNPAVDLFSAAELVFEPQQTGGVEVSATFKTFNMVRHMLRLTEAGMMFPATNKDNGSLVAEILF